MSARITDANVEAAFKSVDRALCRIHGNHIVVTLHLGDRECKITNKLIVSVSNGVSTYSQQVWADGMAGYTKREAYNALRLMAATLALADPE